ncbi:MAG: hypothetical protein QM642_09125 [Edaphocola sp.]
MPIRNTYLGCLLALMLAIAVPPCRAGNLRIDFRFFGDTVSLNLDDWNDATPVTHLSNNAVKNYVQELECLPYQPIVEQLLACKQKEGLDDWLYYQLVRKMAQQISCKKENYNNYTLLKWFLLNKSGLDARLAIRDTQLLFYVYSEDNIYDIPFYLDGQKQYVCLNYHDFGIIDFAAKEPIPVPVLFPEGKNSFSYKVKKMPSFNEQDYTEKDISFDYRNKNYQFRVQVNSQVKTLFANYPVVDYEAYFNIPLSEGTRNSLIPELKEALKGMNVRKGVDYLMRFTRNAFAYENDQENFGKEKRLSPEQTLINTYSDCDDRAALFFCLVKEIYNLPMIVLAYPEHVTIAVRFHNGPANIIYKNKAYTVCEPTPQAKDLSMGEISDKLKQQPFEVAYAYEPDEQ